MFNYLFIKMENIALYTGILGYTKSHGKDVPS